MIYVPTGPGDLVDSHLGKWKEDTDKGGPVKTACLSCRTKKAKCDGQKPVCGQCSRKQLECIYIKSKRGGARVKKPPVPPPSALVEYLKKLDQLLSVPQFAPHGETKSGDDPTNVVRTFGTRDEILRCYYNEVHTYLPLMPPRHYLVDVLPTLLPDSPFLLAVQTVMTLSAHPLDPNPHSAQSKRMRGAASAALGKETLACIERTMAVTTSLEVVQAFTILSVWEWGSTQDAGAANARCSSAAQAAIAMGLHDMDRGGTGFSLEGIDWRMDARRRTWWVLYVSQLSAALVSGQMAPIGPDDQRIHVDFPICSDKDRTWSTWAHCIGECYRMVNVVNQIIFMDGGLANPDDTPEQAELKSSRMRQVDKETMALMKTTEKHVAIEHVPGGEEEVAKNQQHACRFGLAVAQIHIHRWTAFPEVTLFSARICGFPSVKGDEESSTTFSSPPQTGSALSHGSFTSPAVPMKPSPAFSPPNGMFGLPEPAYQFDTSLQFDPNQFNTDMFEMNQMLETLAPAKPPLNGSAPKSSPQFNTSPPFNSPPQPFTNYDTTFGAAVPAMPAAALPPRSSSLNAIASTSCENNLTVPPFNPALQQQWHYDLQQPYELMGDIWQPEIYPLDPAPWFAQPHGAASLIFPIDMEPPIAPPPPQTSPGISSNSASTSSKKHKAWGVDENGDVLPNAIVEAAEKAEAFPPGISLARCATAAHAVVRLQILHRSAAIAMDGPPKWIPYCSCGLIAGAYAFLLLILAVQAENTFGEYSQEREDEVENLMTNIRILVGGLEAYGVMWEGIDAMAKEVKAAAEAAKTLPKEIRSRKSSSPLSLPPPL